jgi:hypothetical protein
LTDKIKKSKGNLNLKIATDQIKKHNQILSQLKKFENETFENPELGEVQREKNKNFLDKFYK